MEFFSSALGVIILFGAIIIVHEFGHFIVAKWSGMEVPEFSIGFGPALFSFKRGDTLYALRALPLGGYVRIAGMETEDTEAQERYNRIPFYKKFATIFAGSAMNFVLALVVFIVLGMAIGLVRGTKVSDVVPDSPAATVGLQSGDRILELNGTANPTSVDIAEIVQESTPPLHLVVLRDGQEVAVEVAPAVLPGDTSENPRPMIGIAMAPYREKVGPGEAIVSGAQRVYDVTKLMLQGIGMLITGNAPLDGVMGPVGMIRATGEVSQQAGQSSEGMASYLMWLALISMNIGLINLLPIPALDGSRLVFLTAEAIRGKPFDREKEAMVHLVGMVLLLGLVLLISVKDVRLWLQGINPFGG